MYVSLRRPVLFLLTFSIPVSISTSSHDLLKPLRYKRAREDFAHCSRSFGPEPRLVGIYGAVPARTICPGLPVGLIPICAGYEGDIARRAIHGPVLRDSRIPLSAVNAARAFYRGAIGTPLVFACSRLASASGSGSLVTLNEGNLIPDRRRKSANGNPIGERMRHRSLAS